MTDKKPPKKTTRSHKISLRQELKEAIREELNKVLLKEFNEYFHRIIVKEGKNLSKLSFTHIKDSFDRAIKVNLSSARKADKSFTKLVKHTVKINDSFEGILKKIADMEETFWFIYTKIKHNQFMYSYYPKEYEEEFHEWKERCRKEEKEEPYIEEI